MKCKNCGRDNPVNAQSCVYCGAQLRRAGFGGKKEKTDKIIIAAIIVLAVLLVGVAAFAVYRSVTDSYGGGFKGGGGGGSYSATESAPSVSGDDLDSVLAKIAELNGGVLPEMTYDDTGVISFIDGQYTDKKVTSYETAIQSLNDIKSLMQFENAAQEYVGKEMYKSGSNQFYKLQQVVNNVPVYNRQCIVETDADGSVVGLMCDYDPGIEIETTPSIGKTQAEEKAKEMSGGAKIYNNLLYVYNDNAEPVLAWGIEIGDDVMTSGMILLSAVDGSLVSAFSNLRASVIEASGTDLKNQNRTFNVSYNDVSYIMKDEERGITVHDAGNSSAGAVVSSSNNTWDNAAAVSAMSDIAQIKDYYSETLGSNAFISGRLSNIDVYVNYKPTDCESDVWSNAASASSGDGRSAVLVFGQGYLKSFDLAAHEFTHAVISATCKLGYMNQPGAVSEAYGDILGNLIQNDIYGGDEWMFAEELDGGAVRCISDPWKLAHPHKLSSRYMHEYCTQNHDHAAAGCDNGGVHANCGVINKAAYLMYEKGISDKQELAKLFSLSMNYMHSNSGFKDCRAALMHAAKAMDLGDDKRNIISEAFAEVGVINEPAAQPVQARGTLSGMVADAITRHALQGVQVEAQKKETQGGGTVTYSDERGNFSMELAESAYRLTITSEGYLACYIDNVNIAESEATYLENTVLLTEIGGNPISRAGGGISNAVSGERVSGVIVRFRSEWGNQTGEYIKNDLGEVVSVTTDDSGQYFTSDLRYGYYTAEVSKEGFATQYVNIIATPDSEVSLEQSIVLVPVASGNDYRITLEWDENPRDEDAHIALSLPDGQDFHVYYGNKEANHNGETIARLDHDDVEGNGFETITLTVDPSASYRYYVHHYAGEGSLAASNAKVKVYRGDVMVNQFNVPTDQGSGRYWRVFEIINGEVVPVNEITDSE